MTEKHYAIIGIVGGLVAALGALLPWVSLNTVFGSVDISGTRGDGIIVLFGGLILAGISFARYAGATPDWARLVISLGGAGLMVYAIWTIARISELADDSEGESFLASVGVGLWMVLAGGFILAGAGAKGKVAPVSGGPPSDASNAPPPPVPPV